MALFESYERRIDKINQVLNSYGIASIEEAEKITKDAGLNVYDMVKGIQPICFENACWAYITGAAIAIKKGCTRAADAAAAIGEGLQAFCIPGSVADQRKVGLGHGNLGKMLLEEETDCFCFLAGHESFAAAEGAIGIAEKANKVRQKPLRVILNGLGKDAAQIIARINGFTYVETDYDYYTGELKEVFRKAYSDGPRAKVNCYGANDVREGVAIMWKEGVDVSIQYNPIEIANNLRRNNGSIPGFRPGKPTSDFIIRTLSKITMIGGVFLAVVAVLPIILGNLTGVAIQLGGTSMLIVVGVALDTTRSLDSYMTMRNHKGFLG